MPVEHLNVVSFLGFVSVLMFLDSRNWAHQQKLLDFECACVRDNFSVRDCKATGVVYAIEHNDCIFMFC